MRESKLTEMLKGISPVEFKRFGEFLNSPFHNKSKKILQLYELISVNYVEFDSNSVTNEKISRSIFAGETNKDQNVRNLISNFTSLLEEFLVLTSITKNTIFDRIILLRALRDRNINKSFDMTSKEVTERLEKAFNKNIDYYYNDLTFKGIVLNYHGKDLDLNMDKNYLEMSDSNDYLFIVTKLKIVNTVLSRRILSGGDIYKNFWGLDHVLNFIESNIKTIEKEHPIIYSEYKILKMMLNPDDEKQFKDLESHVSKNSFKFNEDELEQAYYSISNYCVNKIALGEEKFIHDLYKIHTNFEKLGYYEKNKDIPYVDFISVIICGLTIKDFKWVSYFFEKYKSNISHEVKRDTINLASALITFSSKKYKDCLTHLSRIGYKYTYFYLKSKEILIRAYYELGEYESLIAAIDATKHYLKRHREVLSIHYDRYLLFLNYCNMLIKLDKKQKPEIKILMKKLDEDRNTIAREWLIEKIIELK
jgi:hypothetical protein